MIADMCDAMEAVETVDAWLDTTALPAGYSPRGPSNFWRRVTKVCEESGEVWRAASLYQRENLRKAREGQSATEQEVLEELADTATAALMGMQHLTKNIDETFFVFFCALEKAVQRVQAETPGEEDLLHEAQDAST